MMMTMMKPTPKGIFYPPPVLKTSLTLLAVLMLNACGAADLIGDSKKRSSSREVAANQTGNTEGGFDEDSVEVYGTTADGKPCLKLIADSPNQNPSQTPSQSPKPPAPAGKGSEPKPSKDTQGKGTEPGPLPPCGPSQSGKGGDKGPGKSKADVDVAVDVNNNGKVPPPLGPNQGCTGPLCIFVGVGVGKGGQGCYGPQCTPPPPPPPGGEPPPPPPPGTCPGGNWNHQGKVWNKWSHWKKGACP